MSKLERQWLELTSEKCAVVEVSEQIGSKFRGGNGWALSWLGVISSKLYDDSLETWSVINHYFDRDINCFP